MQKDNLNVWNKPQIATWWSQYAETGLHYNERVILDGLRQKMKGKAILDIGVGAGRTTPFLLEISDNYIGVDYSMAMVSQCQKSFPGVAFHCADARKLDIFSDAQFDMVFFAFNGIDYAPAADRLKILQEISRVSKDGAVFVFSAHNLQKKPAPAWSLKNLSWRKHPVRMARNTINYIAGIINYLRLRHLQTHSDCFSTLLDSAHNYSLLTQYVLKDFQVKQLNEAGFIEISVYNRDAKVLDLVTPEVQSAWLYYVAQKPISP